MKCKIILKIATLFTIVFVFITGCSSNQTQGTGKESENKVRTSQQKSNDKTISMVVARGKVSQSVGLLSVPVVLKNTGSNNTVINSKNFTLKIENQSIKPISIPGEASDYHLDFSSGKVFNGIISFYLGTDLSKKQIKNMKLYYTLDNDKKVEASVLDTTVDQKNIASSMTNQLTPIGEYYRNIISFVKSVQSNKGNPPTIKNQFNDEKYDRFKLWVVIPSSNSRYIVVKALNQTNTDITVPLSDFEISDRDNNETQISPAYRNYNLLIPHGKYATAVIPLENNISDKAKPYTTKLRTNNSEFFDTKKSIYPVETVFGEGGKDLTNLFILSPSQYNTKLISWSKPVLNIQKNSLKISVQINDYFALKLQAKPFKLIGYNDDETIGDKETA
uniref:hypothetical protein n=1 Tax=uncultured Lactobacillus sp. TaxID=153152 RepID=UPI00262AD516